MNTCRWLCVILLISFLGPPAVCGQPLELSDVILLKKMGFTDDQVKREVDKRGWAARGISEEGARRLRRWGGSDKLIGYLSRKNRLQLGSEVLDLHRRGEGVEKIVAFLEKKEGKGGLSPTEVRELKWAQVHPAAVWYGRGKPLTYRQVRELIVKKTSPSLIRKLVSSLGLAFSTSPSQGLELRKKGLDETTLIFIGRWNRNGSHSSTSPGTSAKAPLSEGGAEAKFPSRENRRGKKTWLQWEISFFLDYYDYRESVDRPKKSAEQGPLPGGRIRLRAQPLRLFSFGITIESYGGLTDYDGTNQQGTQVIRDETVNWFLRWEFQLAVQVPQLPERWDLSFYTGVGGRSWLRRLGGSNPFREHYTWGYVPVGFELNYEISPAFRMGLDFSVRFMFAGSIKIYGSDLEDGANDLTLDLGNLPGFRVEVPIEIRLIDGVNLYFAPWYEYSHIGKSTSGILTLTSGTFSVFEPESDAHQGGFYLGVVMYF